MTFQIYRKGMGVYARSAVAGLFGLAAIFAAYSLYGAMIDLPEFYAGARVPVLDIGLTWGVAGSSALFVLCGIFICVLSLTSTSSCRDLHALSFPHSHAALSSQTLPWP